MAAAVESEVANVKTAAAAMVKSEVAGGEKTKVATVETGKLAANCCLHWQ